MLVRCGLGTVVKGFLRPGFDDLQLGITERMVGCDCIHTLPLS